ncbi:hypothetical protein RJ641_000118 [Dillenia turbinata]|uniref:MORF/ORRM1/DAG-like MORF domain-containing protein n=1 Tax=Dillenia turbinata TaxID=194707 RepID=A0AAN8W7G1_9MAGN
MATRSLSRVSLLSKPLLSSLLLSRSSISTLSFSSPSSSLSLFRLRPLISITSHLRQTTPSLSFTVRSFATRQTSSSLNDPNPNWSNRPPKETILLDGCDFEHWLVVMEKPEGEPTRDEIIDSYIKTLAKVIGSEEEARMKMYSVSTRHYFAFGALVSEELSLKIKELPGVRWVLPDSYLDVKNKDYGGEPFINGQAVPYDPKYHEEWVRNNARANERNRRNDRPRNFDRSRNFERRREMQQNRDFQGPPQGNMGGPPPNNMGGPGAPPSNMGRGPNTGGMPPSTMGGGPGAPPSNMGGGPNMGGMPPNTMGGGPNMGGMPTSPMAGGPNMGGGIPPSNTGGGPGPMAGGPNMGGGMPPNNTGAGMPNQGWSNNMPNRDFQGRPGPSGGGMPYQGNPTPNYPPNYQNAYPPNAGNMQGGNQYQSSDMPPPPNY